MSRRARNLIVGLVCAFLVLLIILFGIYVYFITHLRVVYP